MAEDNLVDDILNGTSSKSPKKKKPGTATKSKKKEDLKNMVDQTVEKAKVEAETGSKAKIEPLESTSEVQPEKEPIDIKKPKFVKSAVVKRVSLKAMANRTIQGSVGHDLVFKIKFDEKGVSEPIQDERIFKKLLNCGYSLYKGD